MMEERVNLQFRGGAEQNMNRQWINEYEARSELRVLLLIIVLFILLVILLKYILLA
ncbi:hypothetical protein [Paenibacillus solani]|uniref:hypothetical protein n=1 Tax=Paenibacillus solani TaxID=1705565 RepID=UPI000A76D0DC|nr:hypothetical protein [Paenibacillus solani]